MIENLLVSWFNPYLHQRNTWNRTFHDFALMHRVLLNFSCIFKLKWKACVLPSSWSQRWWPAHFNSTGFQTQLHWELSAYIHYWEGLSCSLFLEWILVICACPMCTHTSFLPFDSSYQMITSAEMFELLGAQRGVASFSNSTFSSHACAFCRVKFWLSLFAL